MDIDQIRTLVELMVENDLSRIEWHDGDSRILLRRGQPWAQPQMSMAPMPAVAAAHAPATQPAPPGGAGAGDATEIFIKSPMVGTFYAASDPDSPAFVSPGAVVGSESVVCLIEAMKVYNEIKAEVSGRITRVLVKNAQAVEFDQPLFAVSPA